MVWLGHDSGRGSYSEDFIANRACIDGSGGVTTKNLRQRLRDKRVEVLCDLGTEDASGIARERLARRFRTLSEEDLRTRGCFILACKPCEISTGC